MARESTTRRSKILDALVTQLKEIDGTGAMQSDLADNVHPRMQFWDEIDQFPALHLAAGAESRQYLPGNEKWRFLTITLRAYVNEEDPVDELEKLLEDIETVIDDNPALQYEDNQGVNKAIAQISIISITTDEGILAPLGVGEMVLEVQY